MTKETVQEIYSKMRDELPLDDVFICYEEGSDCYKPEPGMLLAADKKYNLDFTHSYMIADRWKDITVGKRVGCKTVWIDRGYSEQKPDMSDYRALSLAGAVSWVLKN